MALTGLQIFKLLPKTNCKDCGKPTCLAFAMALAQKKAKLDECPHVSEESKEALAGASAPPIRLVTFGTSGAEISMGQETSLFRHEDKFYHPTAVAVTLADNLDAGALAARVEAIQALDFERVGQKIAVEAICVENKSGQADAFAAATAAAAATGKAVVLQSASADNLKAALAKCGGTKPLLHAATAENAEAVAAVAKEAKCPLAVAAKGPEALAELTETVKAAGVEDLVLDPLPEGPAEAMESLTAIRKAALKKGFRPLGYPAMLFCRDGEAAEQSLAASMGVAKYAGLVVMDTVEPWAVLPVLTARMNIFTDPQKPVQVEPKLYAVGEPGENSPVLFTTNFSLTYYSVESDVEASRVPTWIMAVDTEGTSVLTAYSGDKLNEKVVKKAMDAAKVEETVKHRKLIIPGLVAVMSGKLEEATGWEILVGPRECSILPKYLQEVWK